MSTSTVNISFKKDLLKEIDELARKESRTRSELIREAARLYIERKSKWKRVFAFGEEQVNKFNLKEEDVEKEIKKIRSRVKNKK
ncbi:ribbon-helix-helix protein, CopG family [bacterium]|nr:ribbon-helix-helix protein, CopG family [bacterium]